ncbi:winged helix-turn-helix domain-containing protein [Halocatena marina]|uniref:ArsR family transcriptional regulator n=1 Tax=Halocatena marina TaxID=2934937 RepID=A0ABD5YMG8_9EURY|nr:helix-turn-helix domain-containing protein [Halocatena marina]
MGLTLTTRDRIVLRLLAEAPVSCNEIAATVEWSATDLEGRLESLEENGLLWERDNGTYTLTGSGFRVLETSGSDNRDCQIDVSDQIQQTIGELNLRPDRAKAVQSAAAFLQYWGQASESEIIDGIYSERPSGYESADEWWQTFMRETLASLPDIKPPTNGATVWQYAGTPEIEEHTEDGRSFLESSPTSYGSVKHALETLALTADQRAAVHAAFVVLRHNSTASETALKRESYERVKPTTMSAEAWWSLRIEPILQKLPGIERVDEQTFHYTGDDVGSGQHPDSE